MFRIRRLQEKDVAIIKKWIREPHVLQWFTHPDVWIQEVELRNTEFSFLTHFIAELDGKPIGFCQYYDYTQSKEDWQGTIPIEGSYSIDYFIGEADCLGKGYGTKMVKFLVKQILKKTKAKRIIVQPDTENAISRNTLLSAGFKHDTDNDVFIIERKKSKYLIARSILIFWTLFIGLGAVEGSTMMFIDPSGKLLNMDAMLPYFQVLPFAKVLFQNFLFSGFALLVVNGLTNLTAAYFLFRKRKIGIILGSVFGFTLMLWICIQFIIFPFNFLSTAYFIFGLCQMITGYITWVFYNQENFVFNIKDFPFIGKNPQNLVVYFSRMGYTKKIAFNHANQTGAEVLELKTSERTKGFLGFLWCGRFAMHKWKMAIESMNIDFSKYEHVTICTPVWVFSLSSPVRCFCENAKGKIKSADLVTVHFTKGKYDNIKSEVESLLSIQLSSCTSYCCHFGKIKQKSYQIRCENL